MADFLFIIGILFMVFYHFGRVTHLSFQEIENGTVMHHHGPIVSKQWKKVNHAAYYFGTVAIVPFSLLWIPVSRGSPFLRLIGLPFEHAVKYHSWLAVLMMFFVTLRSIGYIVFYMHTGQTALFTGWVTRGEKCAVVAGLVAWIVVWNYHFFVIPILLFFMDRFLRMLQSRQLVDVLSAKALESGAVELHLARNSSDGFVFHALSTWCIQIPSLSKLQWHFFSVASTPTKEDHELTIVIKPLGAWTRKLHNQLKAATDAKYSQSSCPFSFKARVEGPYGDESDFYLTYETLVLVAGGIGVTPILAILRDILHRHKVALKKASHLPTSIEVYHCVRTPVELCVLNEIDPNQILPDYGKLGLSIHVHAYITSKLRELYTSQLATHVNTGENRALDLAKFGGSNHISTTGYVSPNRGVKPQGISSISSVGNTKWVAAITISSMIGYFVFSGLANLYIVRAYSYNFPNYNRAHVVVICMLLGIILFGGALLIIWLIHNKTQKENTSLIQPKGHSTTNSPTNYPVQEFYDNEANVGCEGGSPWNGDLHLCCRPDWKDVFNHLSNKYKGQSVGVLVSGSQSMQEDVASECRSHSKFLFPVTAKEVAFDFHSISFDL
ncbi:hypothetical protein GOP47_0008129 [Adiantum capillus-veneris]|uniref:FAD-binding FR-type domain-containing protein n=1 Tax=Adiantum capillus-veneris TaxID=13818 RepID=A0A9D4UY53_ADICA|nr:hypothetical protein GOP47_0008129 [Adiantum capillus-veneris]